MLGYNYKKQKLREALRKEVSLFVCRKLLLRLDVFIQEIFSIH